MESRHLKYLDSGCQSVNSLGQNPCSSCTTVPVVPPGGGKILTSAFYAFSSEHSVLLFRSLMLTPGGQWRPDRVDRVDKV